MYTQANTLGRLYYIDQKLTNSFKLPEERLRADNILLIVLLINSLMRSLVGGNDRSLSSTSSLVDIDNAAGSWVHSTHSRVLELRVVFNTIPFDQH